ncbi:MAG TPA: hypothetical protein VF815_29040 [Myxococcaceae bacterium]|jgi:hypothetical protein
MDTSVAEQRVPPTGNLFSAFQEQSRVPNRRWLIALAVPLLGGLAAWASLQGKPTTVHIITPTGIKAVSLGMSQQDVLSRLGKPIGRESRAGGLECFQHGMFSLLEPATTIHTVCYLDGVLKEVSTRRFSMWEVGPDGAFMPAGMPTGPAPTQPAPAPKP